jgi:hypothetical protein
MTMEEAAAREWTNELNRAGNDISLTTRRLQAIFQNESESAVERGYVTRLALGLH